MQLICIDESHVCVSNASKFHRCFIDCLDTLYLCTSSPQTLCKFQKWNVLSFFYHSNSVIFFAFVFKFNQSNGKIHWKVQVICESIHSREWKNIIDWNRNRILDWREQKHCTHAESRKLNCFEHKKHWRLQKKDARFSRWKKSKLMCVTCDINFNMLKKIVFKETLEMWRRQITFPEREEKK